jgi:hypothetical protein
VDKDWSLEKKILNGKSIMGQELFDYLQKIRE